MSNFFGFFLFLQKNKQIFILKTTKKIKNENLRQKNEKILKKWPARRSLRSISNSPDLSGQPSFSKLRYFCFFCEIDIKRQKTKTNVSDTPLGVFYFL